jgi:hypothetical protein
MLISHKYLAEKEKRGMLLLRRGDAGRIDAEADQGQKHFSFFAKYLIQPGAPEPDEPEKPAR